MAVFTAYPTTEMLTAAQIIQNLCAEIGYPQVEDPYSSADPIHGRMCALLNTAGKLLQGMHEWQNLEVTYELTTGVADSGSYNLPADFIALTDQTGWQQNYFWPLRGPYSAQMWQRIVNYPTTGIYVAFRIMGQQLLLWPQPPPTDITISFIYKSSSWVIDGGTKAGKPSPTQASDIIYFDGTLMMLYLKLRYLASIGHDTEAAEEEFKLVFDMKAAQSDGAAPELQIARDARFPFITGYNAPDTGFGGQPPSSGSYM